MPPESPIPHFPATRWSVVLAAAGEGQPARAALEELCRLYWFPLYAFARQRGCSPEDAEDETQQFLAEVANGPLLFAATPARGHLRSYLLAAFQRDLIDSHRRTQRMKRGGGAVTVPLDLLTAEDRLEQAAAVTPHAAFDRAWALTCIESAVAAVAAEYAARGRSGLFQTLRPFLDPESDVDYTAASHATGLDANALRQAVFRLRQRFRALLRQQIADTLADPSEGNIEEELAELRRALSA